MNPIKEAVEGSLVPALFVLDWSSLDNRLVDLREALGMYDVRSLRVYVAGELESGGVE